ncbi:hypothetical protein ACCAA_400051 [Candidatus Accumulibacter aalborgensis]|uniref:Uncharacterized protein n=1 Tax=Candidatus Accumulibacter aalborgensis TaxID=1860102 RepID=A0A1A8XPX4_9PROT|nr:hypothetical protein ACCAA_400051 [Candidatus Accumulibacter aalborgensis]
MNNETRQRNLPLLEVSQITDGSFRMFWHGGTGQMPPAYQKAAESSPIRLGNRRLLA